MKGAYSGMFDMSLRDRFHFDVIKTLYNDSLTRQTSEKTKPKIKAQGLRTACVTA